MPNKVAGTQRTFDFDFPVDRYPQMLERLRGTPTRVDQIARSLTPHVLVKRDGQTWSIQENIGHLLDLGYLPLRRIEQILAGEANLIAADMSNRKTREADHNTRNIQELLAEFRSERTTLVARFESLDKSDWAKSARHPRLDQPMRIVDIAYFDSEHDDYHLARLNELIRAFA